MVHRDRLWKYSGVECADLFQGPAQDKSEDVSSWTTTQQENQEVNPKEKSIRQMTKGDKSLTTQIQEEELPGQGGMWQGIEAAAGPGWPQAIQ